MKLFESTLTEKDFHPGSEDQVVNLVHPSLFCLVYGKSTDTNDKILYLKCKPDDYYYSDRYQWLPAEFLVDYDGKVKIGSYINNLPVDSGLYPVIAEIFERVLPLFNRVLSDLRTHRLRIRFQPNMSIPGSNFVNITKMVLL